MKLAGVKTEKTGKHTFCRLGSRPTTCVCYSLAPCLLRCRLLKSNLKQNWRIIGGSRTPICSQGCGCSWQKVWQWTFVNLWRNAGRSLSWQSSEPSELKLNYNIRMNLKSLRTFVKLQRSVGSSLSWQSSEPRKWKLSTAT
jgi:hypothetical protein